MNYQPFYNPNLCRVCDDPLDRIHRAENRLMHPRCEQEWLALTPFPPCKFCEDFLSPDDVAARRTLHPHCELELFRRSPPGWPLPQEVAQPEEEGEANESCGLCGEPLYPDDIRLGATMHKRCQNVSQVSDDEIENEDDSDPILHCFDCGERVSAEEAVGVPDFSGVWPRHRPCADARRSLTDMELPGS